MTSMYVDLRVFGDTV